jgi:cytochrome c nitrite reductase small subunit
MIENKKTKYLLFLGIFFVVLIFTFFGPPRVLERTSSPDFCNSCHVMNLQHEAWFKSGLHRTLKCVDCHLPNNNIANHFLWKGIDGMKDLIFFHSNFFTEPITISSHGKSVLQQNCIRCHDSMVSNINPDRDCWDCHKRVNHRVAAFATE